MFDQYSYLTSEDYTLFRKIRRKKRADMEPWEKMLDNEYTEMKKKKRKAHKMNEEKGEPLYRELPFSAFEESLIEQFFNQRYKR